MTRRHWIGISMLLLAACSHSDPFAVNVPAIGPSGSGSDIRLTFNSDQDYWPIWTEDGAGILYAYVAPGATVAHRCIGLLPAAGGSRIWQLCDDRANQKDSTSSFQGFALGADGRLIYAESVARNQGAALSTTTLWLADSAAPFARTSLLTLPVAVDANSYNSLGDIQWTGPTTFVALAQLVETFSHCKACGEQDTLLLDRGLVVKGTIAGGRATLAGIGGTDGATAYSLAENGASVVFTRANDTHLFKVAAAGGAVSTVTDVTSDAITPGPRQLVGVSCRAGTCVVASDPITLSYPVVPSWPSLNAGVRALLAVTLGSGSVQVLMSNSGGVMASPRFSPVTGDLVMQIGGGWWGHLQTFTGFLPSDLHLYPGLVP